MLDLSLVIDALPVPLILIPLATDVVPVPPLLSTLPRLSQMTMPVLLVFSVVLPLTVKKPVAS